MIKEDKHLTISERFLLIRKEFSLTAGLLGELAGVTGTAIAKIESGETLNPKADVLARISSKLQINLNWLLLGEGEMFKPAISSNDSDVHYDPEKGDLVPRNSSGTMLMIDEPELSLNPRLLKTIAKAMEKRQSDRAGLQNVKAPNDAHAVGFLSDMPSVELPHASFKTWASFIELGGADVGSHGNLPTLLYRLPPGRTAADYEGAIVFDIEGDSMEPTMQSGQQVIAWFIPEGKWEHLHNTACVVAYDDTVTVKAILDNDLFINNRLTLRATRQGGGSFTVGRSSINSIWEVREFYGRVPYRLFAA